MDCYQYLELEWGEKLTCRVTLKELSNFNFALCGRICQPETYWEDWNYINVTV